MDAPLTRFGEWLVSQNVESLRALAKEVGCPPQYGDMWIRGKRKPTPAQIERLAAMFGTTTDHLYHLLGKIPPDIDAGLRKATPDVFRAIRLYL